MSRQHFKSRAITKIVKAQATSDGAGVNLFRSLGSQALPMVEPFLMLDEFRSDNPSDYIAGFPPHPHRGFETVTYVLAGSMQHKDSKGNTGNLRAGSVQWMTAARGIIHSEMPRQEDGLMWGFQLWVNLPARDKMGEPRYQDIEPEAIMEVELSGGSKARVLAGSFGGATGPVGGVATAPQMLDIRIAAGQLEEVAIPADHNGFVYVYQGTGRFGDQHQVATRETALVLGRNGDGVRVKAGEEGVSFLAITGRPIQEPVARYGPFVMNTREELEQAFLDYQQGRLAS